MAVVSLSDFRSARQPQIVNQPNEPVDIDDILKGFTTHLLAERGIGKVTAGLYRRAIKVVLDRVGTSTPSRAEYLEYVAGMHEKMSYKHIVNTSLAIESYSRYLGDPVKLGRPRKPKEEIGEILSEGEVAVVLAVGCRTVREKAMVSVLAYSGIRNNELCNLKVRDVDLAENELHVRLGKGSKDRTVQISGDCARVVMNYLHEFPRGEGSYLFTTLEGGRQYTSWALRKLVKTAAVRAGIAKKVHPHLFRHSLAVNMLKRGADVFAIQHQLGHEHVQTTIETYLRSYRPNAKADYLKYAPSYT